MQELIGVDIRQCSEQSGTALPTGCWNDERINVNYYLYVDYELSVSGSVSKVVRPLVELWGVNGAG